MRTQYEQEQQAKAKAKRDKALYELFTTPNETVDQLIASYPIYRPRKGLSRKVLGLLRRSHGLKEGWNHPDLSNYPREIKEGVVVCKIGNQLAVDYACIYNRLTPEQQQYARANLDMFNDNWVPPNP